MAAHKQKARINLLPFESFAASTPGRVLAWVLSTFRIIVIVVEMIVMVAFLSRFWLDTKSADLSDEIENKKAIITSYGDVEPNFRAMQSRLSVMGTLAKNPNLTTIIRQSISPYVPPSIILTTISATYSNISITGATLSEADIAQFMSNLKSTDKFSSVNLESIESVKDTSLVGFSIVAEIIGSQEDK